MKLKLSQVFTLSLVGLSVMLGLLFYVVLEASRAAIVESSERIREGVSREIGERVTQFLTKAPDTARQVELALKHGLADPRDLAAVEAMLFAPLLADKEIGELTLTYGRKVGFDTKGAIKLAPEPRGQLSVGRSAGRGGDDQFWSRHVHQAAGGFVSERREYKAGELFSRLPKNRQEPAIDPTLHATFTGPASEALYGSLLTSDLHWSQLDEQLPAAERRGEVSVQQVVSDAAGAFAGVLRVGLLTRQLDHAVQIKIVPGEGDPHRIFICDAKGRLITRGDPRDSLSEFGDDLRIAPGGLSPELKRALGTSELQAVSEEEPLKFGTFFSNGEEWLSTFRALPGTQDWVAGIVVPRSFYLGKLTAIRNRLLLVSLGVIALLVIAGGLVSRGVRHAQFQIVSESLKMKSFEFTPSPTRSAFSDVIEVLESFEQAKTAMRAMGKYVPVDLVRRLYSARSEPMLGGEPMEISVMFTDIKDFTTLSERLAPNELAAILGQYLEVMACVIQQETRGTIDKYIGDAIMTIWNAPEPVPDHARMACLAALRCRQAVRELASSEAWGGRPPFETRFGLHLDVALVGHFGAPDRINYTAIGDGINLASRLEGLNKLYGTSIIASKKIVDRAGAGFAFRLLDLVAVKGKEEAVQIYELLGEKGTEEDPFAAGYERAFKLYLARDFEAAAAILKAQGKDNPSRVLLERCVAYQQNSPSSEWCGVYMATEK